MSKLKCSGRIKNQFCQISILGYFRNMNPTLLSALCDAYHFSQNSTLEIAPFGEGLIHQTYLITQGEQKWILQGFNQSVFNFPDRIDHNLAMLYQFAKNHPLPFQLPLPIKNKWGKGLSEINGHHYRLFNFVQGKTLQQIDYPTQAYLAAKAYGEFANWAKDVDAKQMQETIPNFHRLDLRFEKLAQVAQTKSGLTLEEQEILDFYLSQKPLVDWYLNQIQNLPLRVMHNDTKINNLIFSNDLTNVEAIIDLDTLMGGYLMYDFGDLVRTVACSLPETSTDWKEINLLSPLFEELSKGYWQGVKSITNSKEAESLLFGGEIMTLIMGLRFFTDHLQGNIYYKVTYPEQNFHRAKNQMIFLKSQQSQRELLKAIWTNITSTS
jgi:Ser/Thr protein kinase RdoA (MazF antagonist)